MAGLAVLRPIGRAAAAALAAGLVMSAARPAAAQSSGSGRLYVGAAVVGDVKRFSGPVGDSVFDGDAAGGSLTVGTALHPRWDLQIGVDVPQFTSQSRDRSVTLQRARYTLVTTTRSQVASVATLVRLHGASARRVQVGYLAGLSVIRLRRNVETSAPPRTPASLIPRSTATVDYTAAPTLGIDARIAFGRHLSVVPGLQTIVFRVSDVSAVTLRPRVELRWGF